MKEIPRTQIIFLNLDTQAYHTSYPMILKIYQSTMILNFLSIRRLWITLMRNPKRWESN